MTEVQITLCTFAGPSVLRKLQYLYQVPTVNCKMVPTSVSSVQNGIEYPRYGTQWYQVPSVRCTMIPGILSTVHNGTRYLQSVYNGTTYFCTKHNGPEYPQYSAQSYQIPLMQFIMVPSTLSIVHNCTEYPQQCIMVPSTLSTVHNGSEYPKYSA